MLTNPESNLMSLEKSKKKTLVRIEDNFANITIRRPSKTPSKNMAACVIDIKEILICEATNQNG